MTINQEFQQLLIEYGTRFLAGSEKEVAQKIIQNSGHYLNKKAIKLLCARIDLEESFKAILSENECEVDARLDSAITILQEIKKSIKIAA